MAVVLKNKAKRMLVFNLPHADVCTDTECLCSRHKVGVQDHNPKTGEKTLRVLHRRLAGSLTLCAAGTPGDTSGPLPNGVARLPEVRALVKSGAIEASLVKDEPAPATDDDQTADDQTAPAAAKE